MHHKSRGQANRKAMRELPEEDPEFQIAPMIDILLVLLVFFMSIASTQVLQVRDDVRLAVANGAKTPGERPEGEVVVNVLWSALQQSGLIEIGGQEFATGADAEPIIKEEVSRNANARVLIRADREVRYEFIRGLLKAAGSAGASNVTFSVVDKE